MAVFDASHIVDNDVEGSELYCYNTEGEENSVVSQASCIMDVTLLEQRDVKIYTR